MKTVPLWGRLMTKGNMNLLEDLIKLIILAVSFLINTSATSIPYRAKN